VASNINGLESESSRRLFRGNTTLAGEAWSEFD